MNEVAASTLVNPFVGLRPYEEHESYLFFGRDGQSDELTARLGRKRFVAVVGASGSGKSSLVRAGLFASLHGGFMASAGSSWRVALMRPGNAPLASLAAALHGSLRDRAHDGTDPLPAAVIEATLRRSSLGLIEAVQQARIPRGENVLVVVDQFEELFRFRKATRDAQAEADAAAFVKLLIEAPAQTEVPIYMMLTMRSDFLGDCAQFRGLPEAMNDSQYLIPRMNRDERRQAIVGPIGVGGARISPRLVQRLLNDVGEDPDQLPVLQHALMRTWQRWETHRHDGSPLDLDDYESIGTMEHALSRHADEAYGDLDENGKAIGEKVFKRLTERGPDNREIRRPTPFGELCAVAQAAPDRVARVIDRFRTAACSFLMPPAAAPLHSDTFVDISHESLIRKWTHLAQWVNEESDSRTMYARLADASIRHREGKAGLWRNPDLKLARNWFERERPNADWARRYGGEFALADRFLKRSASRSFAIRGAVAVVAIALVALTIDSWRARQSAQAEAARAAKATSLALDVIKALTYDVPNSLSGIPGAPEAVMDVYAKNQIILEELGKIVGETAGTVRERAANSMRLGDVYLNTGKLQRARAQYQIALPLYERLVSAEPDNLDWKRDLSIYYERMGNLLRAEGDPTAALGEYRKGLAIVERLARDNPDKPEWQRAVSVIHEKIGDTLLAQGDAEGALREYRIDLDIAAQLAAAAPGDRELQQDLAISHARVADALAATGKTAESAEHKRSAQAIVDALRPK